MSNPCARGAGALARVRGVQASVFACTLSLAMVAWIWTLGGPSALRDPYGAAAPVVSLIAHTLVNVTPVADMVPWALANGAIYGVALGALLNWLAWIGASAILFALARSTAADLNFETDLRRLPGWLRRLPIHHPLLLICARWVPIGNYLVNIAAGALGVAFRRYLWCTALGSAAPAILLALAGAGLVRVLD